MIAKATASIHRRLLTGLLVTIVALSGTMLATTFAGARQAVELLSGQIIEQTSSEMEARLELFLGPAKGGLSVVLAWAREGLLPLQRPDVTNRLLIPMMREFPQISAIVIADEQGREAMLLRTPEGWINRHSDPALWGARSRRLKWRDGGEVAVSWHETGYDARTRPWYIGALATPGEVHWTRPYEFFTFREPGVTVSQSFTGAHGQRQVLAFDLALRDISRFTMTLTAGANGRVFVLTDDDRVVGLPALEHFKDPATQRQALLKSPKDIGVALVRDAANALKRDSDSTEPVRFRSAGASWWGASRTFELGPSRNLRMIVAVPEADLVASLQRLRYWILGLTTLVIGFGVWQATALARQLSRPIAALADDSDRIAAGDLTPASPIATGISEVSRLANAHEHMRSALRTLLKLERDLQIAQEIQQSTIPSAVPSLSGYTLAAWNEPAEETGGDTYDLIGVQDRSRSSIAISDTACDRIVMLLADATGHGIGPALSVTQVRAMLRMAVRTRTSLPRIVDYLNEQLCEDLTGGRFVTAWLAEIRADSSTLRSFSAGQGPMLHFKAAGGSILRLLPDAPPLGLLPEFRAKLAPAVKMEHGDVLAVLSDGIYEARNVADVRFGVDRVETVLRNTAEQEPEQMLAAVRQSLTAFCAGMPADDDRTMILIKRSS